MIVKLPVRPPWPAAAILSPALQSMNLFAYGSLMFPEVWRRVAGQSFPTQAARLPGFAAWRVRGESYPGLAPDPAHTTNGVVHLGVCPESAQRLDEFEGPFYERTAVTVVLDDGSTLPACAYIVGAAHRHHLEEALWDVEAFRRDHLAGFMGPRSIE